jgi:hypothetical protein
MAATCYFFDVNRRCPTLRPALSSEIPAHYMRHSMFALKGALMNLCSCIVHLVTISYSNFLEAGGSTSLVSEIYVFSIANILSTSVPDIAICMGFHFMFPTRCD